jgi:hypothetical protein
MVWRETGAVRNARPSRGRAAAHPEEGEVGGTRELPRDRIELKTGSQRGYNRGIVLLTKNVKDGAFGSVYIAGTRFRLSYLRRGRHVI